MVSAIFMLVLASGAIAAGAGYVRKARAMRGYRSARGSVIARDVVAIPGGDTREAAFGEGGGYTPKLTYRFTVEGREYTSDRLGYATRGFKHAVARRRADAYPDEVEVWFDPANPAEAYLERHSPTVGWLLIAGGSLVALGVAGWFAAQ